MQQWNGLLRKEWVTLKAPLIVIALFAVATMLFLPILITHFWWEGVEVFELALIMCTLWAVASTLAPVVTLFIMLEREMKRPDVWLHSNASIFKLVGSKVVFAVIIGIGGLLISPIALAVQYAIFRSSTLSFEALLFYGSVFIVVIFVASLSILCTGFFFWVLYRLMVPIIKGFVIIVLFILFGISSWAVESIRNSDIYTKLVKVGPIDLLKLKNPNLDIGNAYLEVTSTTFYTGEIVYNVLFTVFVFVIAAVLFEKKVRL